MAKRELKQFLETGKIVGTHGVRGEIKLEVWSDSPEVVKNVPHLYFDDGKIEIKTKTRRTHKNMLLMTIENVDSVEQADLLRGRVVFLNRDDIKLPSGKHFLQDIMGLEVVDADTGRVYGKVTDFIHTGANDVYEITGEKKYLFPAVKEMIKAYRIEDGILEVKPIAGIFDDAVVKDEVSVDED